jgi:hypothetical protein
MRKRAPLVLREKPAHFTTAAARLQQESAWVQRRKRGVEFNPGPVTRKYRFVASASIYAYKTHGIGTDRDRFSHQPMPHGSTHSPGQQRNLQTGKRQDWPKPLHREEASHTEGRAGDHANEYTRTLRR